MCRSYSSANARRSPSFARAMTSGTGPATSRVSAVTLATLCLKRSSLPFLTCATGPYRPRTLFANGPWVPKSSGRAYGSASACRLWALAAGARLFDCGTPGLAVLPLGEAEPGLIEGVGLDLEDLRVVQPVVGIVLVERDEMPVGPRPICGVHELDHRVRERVVHACQLRRRIRLRRDTIDDPLERRHGARADRAGDGASAPRPCDVVRPPFDEPPVEADVDAVNELVLEVVDALVMEHPRLVVRDAVETRSEPQPPDSDEGRVLVAVVRERDELAADDARGLVRGYELHKVGIADRPVGVRHEERSGRRRLSTNKAHDVLVDPPVLHADA